MNKKILLLFSFVLLFCLNINAVLIENPSFEDYIALDTNAEHWEVKIASDGFADIYSDTNGECGGGHGSGNWALPADYGQWELAGNPNGDYVFFASGLASGQRFINVNDYFIGTLQNDLNFCFSFMEPSLNKYSWGYGIFKEDQNIFCEIEGSVGFIPQTTWVNTCRTIPAGIYNGYFTLYHTRNIEGGTFLMYADNGFSGTNLEVQISNHTVIQAFSGTEVTFKTKVARTDLNTFLSDSNVYLTSEDINGQMIYNTSTEFYELSHTFSADKLGAYSFDVNAIDSAGDLNYLNNEETFSLTFVKETDLVIPVTNTTKISEFQTGTDSYSATLTPIDESEDMIFYFNGEDSNNFGSLIDLNFLIRNSNLSGNRYIIYSASESEFESGAWNLDSTLSFGSTIYNGLQKIWIDANSFYEHKFQDSTIFGNEIKYFKLNYKSPIFSWASLDPNRQSDWDIQLLPSVFESGNHLRDFFPVSQFNNVRNQFKTKVADINSNLGIDKFLLVFNGQVESGTFGEEIGKNAEFGADTTTTVTVSTTETTFHVPSGADFPLMKGDSATFVQLMNSDYALIERGFFVKPLTLLNPDYSEIERILIEDSNGKVIGEGEKFRILSQLYNRNGELSFLEGKVYFGSVDDTNQVAYFKQDLNDLTADELFNLDWLVDGIIDLNGTTARDFIVVLKATNKNGDWFEIQTDTFKLRQYPNSTAEFSLNAFLKNKIVGRHLSGRIEIKINAPQNLRGIKVYVYRVEEGVGSGYIKTFYKDEDFTCTGFNCEFNFELVNQVFDGAGVWFFTISALLTTQLEDHNSLLTAKTYSFPVNFLEFETGRILQTIERTPDANYTNEEIIPFVLQLRDGDRSNLRNKVKVKFFVSACDGFPTGGSCNVHDVNYSPDGFLYDLDTGYNYFFLNRIFIRADGSLLTQVYHRITAVVEDIEGSHDGEERFLLTSKCPIGEYGTDFFANALSTLNHFITGNCTIPPDPIVTVGDANELRFAIDNDFALNPPTQECSFCMNADNNGNYTNNLEQDLFCGTWYTYNSQRIDRFDFYLTNQNSDLSKEDGDAQYIKTSVPFELISFNDLSLMRQSMAIEYGTEADTIGELLQQGFNYLFTGLANPVSDEVEGLTAGGIINNVGFDCNFSRPLDPTYIDGMLFYKIKGIKTINKQDMVVLNPELADIPAVDLIEFMNLQNISVPRNNTVIEVYASDMVKVMNETVDSPLVIDISLEETKITGSASVDQNLSSSNLPSTLRFNAIFDLFYDNELTVIRRIVPLTITAVITGTFLDLTGLVNEITTNPASFLIKNWFFIFLGFVCLLGIVYVRYVWNKGSN